MKVSFHLVEARYWPIFTRIGIFFSILNLLIYTRGWNFYFFITSQLCLIITLRLWWRDVNRESLIQGLHPLRTEEGLKKGFILFIISEVIFFFRFFWGFFQFSLAPTIELGSIWPPTHLLFLDSLGIPLLNTIILLSRGVLVTLRHHSILTLAHNSASLSLGIGLILGIIFTMLQANEYINTRFSIIDSVLGTSFFVITGFHGLHVLIGRTFLLIILVRAILQNLSPSHHAGFEIAAWYWHFVDVVWIFLFIFIYLWGSNLF